MKSIYLFPGQGSQYVGMVGDHASEVSQAVFKEANEILGFDLYDLCAHGPAEKLNETINSQLAIFVTSWIAFLELCQYFGETPIEEEQWFAGLSLGEYTAMAASGCLSFRECLRLIQERAKCMQDACNTKPGGMVTVLGLENSVVASICEEISSQSEDSIRIANYLFRKGHVVSGGVPLLDRFEKESKKRGATITNRLKVSGAFHTPYMMSARENLEATLSKCQFRLLPASKRVFSNQSGKEYKNFQKLNMVHSLSQQLVEPVLWESFLELIIKNYQPGDRIYEVGPGKQIASMMRRMNPPPALMSNFTSIAAGTLKSVKNQQSTSDGKTSQMKEFSCDYSKMKNRSMATSGKIPLKYPQVSTVLLNPASMKPIRFVR